MRFARGDKERKQHLPHRIIELGGAVLDFYQIEGGIPLRGEYRVKGAKNAALPIMHNRSIFLEPAG